MDQKMFIIIGLSFISISFIGFYLAYLYGRKTKYFRWSEYSAILILPVVSVILVAYFIDMKVILLFILSALLGTFLEYIIGLTYHKALNKKLWTYSRYSLDGYTSILCIPIWGVAGVVFWFLSKCIGL